MSLANAKISVAAGNALTRRRDAPLIPGPLPCAQAHTVEDAWDC